MAVALHGNLRDFGIAEVFQLIGQQRKTGLLVVGEGSDAVFLSFDEGRVVAGGSTLKEDEGGALGSQLVRSGYLTRDQLRDLVGESARSARPIADLLLASGRLDAESLGEVQDLLTHETVFDIMRRKSGEFHFSAEPIVHDLPPERLLGAEQILMDGLRMLDEWQTFVAAVPSEEIVFRRVGSLESSRAFAAQGGDDGRLAQVERVLKLIDGRLSVRRVVDLSRVGTFEATRVLAELRQAGLIEVVASEVRRPARRPISAKSMLPSLRTAVATAVPFGLLLALAGVALERSGPTGGLPGSPIPDRVLHRVGADAEAQLVRQLVDLHAFETGAYPDRLEAVAGRASELDRSLTSARLAEYYYAVRDDEVVLLPPLR
ncbi:MAG: DUF4388 domain-containing protein [Myxococcota bacterium]